MKLTFPIPKPEQDNVMGAFWALLKSEESRVESENDNVGKHLVEGYFRLWTRVTGQTRKARWEK